MDDFLFMFGLGLGLLILGITIACAMDKAETYMRDLYENEEE